MPTISFDAQPLDSKDALFALFGDLVERGWVGALGFGADSAADAVGVWRLNAHAPATASSDGALGPDGVRRLSAAVGDVKVVIGNTITTLTPDAYSAAYGTSTP